MKQEVITCINCPVGCRLTVTLEAGEVKSVSGNACRRGETYARQECVAPARVITAAAPVKNRATPVSVKTHVPVPKEMIDRCMEAILAAEFEPPIRIGDVLIKNVCATGADVVATRHVE